MNGMNGFKGFDKDLKCRGMQYAIGETVKHSGTVRLCNSGLHFVEHPLDALAYYPPGKGNRYAVIEADGVSAQTETASKRVAQSLTVKAELKIPALIKAAVEFTFQKSKPTTGDSAHSATTGHYAHSATTGDSAHSATTGYSAHSATTGDSAHSATTGDSAHSATTGDYAHSATTGDYYAHSATTGYSAHSATTGYSAHSATTGDYAHSATTGDSAHSATTGSSANSSALGKNTIAAALGYKSRAKGARGSFLVLAEYKDDGVTIKAVGVAQVRGKIKPDTWYVLKNGKFTEVPE